MSPSSEIQSMQTKPPAHSLVFNSRFLIALCVFLLAGSLVALGTFSNASAQPNPASQTPNATQQEHLKSVEIQPSRNDVPRPLGQQCASLRGPIVILSESFDISSLTTAAAAFNSLADEFLITWDQFVGAWSIVD